MEDLGATMRVRTITDSSAASGIANRRGLGKVRHIEVNQLWLHDKVSSKEVDVRKVKGDGNLAGALTTRADQTGTGQHMKGTGQGFKEGRHALAPSA